VQHGNAPLPGDTQTTPEELEHLLKEIISLGWCMVPAGMKEAFINADCVQEAQEVVNAKN
jgi:hypothetical protein